MLPRLPDDDSFVSFWIVGEELRGRRVNTRKDEGRGWEERRPHWPAQSLCLGQGRPALWRRKSMGTASRCHYPMGSQEARAQLPGVLATAVTSRGLPPGQAILPARLALPVRQPKASL